MTIHLERDLLLLKRRLLEASTLAEQAIRRATASLAKKDKELARSVIEGDAEIDSREIEVEEEAIRVLAIHQPVATDLRFIAACLKINNDLERIGDLAAKVAKRVLDLYANDADDPQVPGELFELSELVINLLRRALDAFARGDVEMARKVRVDDDPIDGIHRDLFFSMREKMKQSPKLVEPANSILSISSSLERIADHVTNIAEDVIYMVGGQIVRHPGHGSRGASTSGR
ncbi:MAG: phosphate signaling complex protein PhoU [Planctomycetes bacterium]|nr:phosphate signaling complex protein PhoU [Planctomycetota bacterium]